MRPIRARGCDGVLWASCNRKPHGGLYKVSLALAVVIVPISKEYFFWTTYLLWNVKWMG